MRGGCSGPKDYSGREGEMKRGQTSTTMSNNKKAENEVGRGRRWDNSVMTKILRFGQLPVEMYPDHKTK